MARSKTKLQRPQQSRSKSGSGKRAPQASASQTAKRRTKSGQILALLRHPGGATLKAIMVATGWQAHSVRGFISGHLVKKLGLQVNSLRRDGERVYLVKTNAERSTGSGRAPARATKQSIIKQEAKR